MEKRTQKRLLIAAACILALLAAGALAAHVATRVVEARIVDWLGPWGKAGRIEVGLAEVVLYDVDIGAPDGWPAEKTLQAAHIACTPDWRSLVSRRLVIRTLTMDDFYLSARRSPHRIELLPTLSAKAREKREKDAREGKQPSRRWETEIGNAYLRDGRVDYYDTVAAKPAHRMAFDRMQAQVGPLYFPRRAEQTRILVSGRVLGKARSGTVAVDGWLAGTGNDADVRTRLHQVDVPALAPYLYKKAPAALAGGSVDLDMRTRIQQRRLDAAGHLELRDLRFGEGGENLLSLPRKAVLAALEDRNGTVSFDFTLTGNLDDPKFSLDDSLSMRMVGGLSKAIGVSAKGVAEGVGGAVRELGDALSDLVEQK